MAVTAVLVYELLGATRAQHAVLRDALAQLPKFKPTDLHNTWEIERPRDPNLHNVIEDAFRSLLTMFKIETANFRIYTATRLEAGTSKEPSPPAAPRPR